jgi:hypothetical protein
LIFHKISFVRVFGPPGILGLGTGYGYGFVFGLSHLILNSKTSTKRIFSKLKKWYSGILVTDGEGEK